MWSQSLETLNPYEALMGEKKEKPQTNADRIRAMSDEELASIIASTPICKERYMDCLKYGRDCEPCLLEWLKQPAEGE